MMILLVHEFGAQLLGLVVDEALETGLPHVLHDDDGVSLCKPPIDTFLVVSVHEVFRVDVVEHAVDLDDVRVVEVERVELALRGARATLLADPTILRLAASRDHLDSDPLA